VGVNRCYNDLRSAGRARDLSGAGDVNDADFLAGVNDSGRGVPESSRSFNSKTLETQQSSSRSQAHVEHAHHYAPISSDKDFQYALSRNQFKSKEFEPLPNRLGYGGKRLYENSHFNHVSDTMNTHSLIGSYPDVGVSLDERYQTMNNEYYTDFVNAPSQPVARVDLGRCWRSDLVHPINI
jgi:hypothetical protein